MLPAVIHKDESTVHFEAFFEYATMGIVVTDNSGKITAVNPFALKEFGYAEEELLGNKIEILIPPRFHNSHDHYQKLYAASPGLRNKDRTKEIFAIKKDGTEFPVEIGLSNYNKNGGQYIIAFINNITIRKQAETGLKQLNEELETNVQQRTADLNKTLQQLELSRCEMQKVIAFQKALMDKAGAIIVSVDNNGIIQTFNPEAERELGYTAAELIGQHTPLVYHYSSQLYNRAKELSEELQQPVPASMELFYAKARLGLPYENEWLLVRKDGTKFPVRLNIAAMKDEQNNIIGYVGAAFDISKTKKIEQELQQALEKEKELSELKSRFISMASHEFRTPLSTVLSSSYLIEKYITTEDQLKREKHLQRIVSSVNMLTDILNDFLSVGKMEEGKIQLRLTQFNIRELIISVAEEMKNNLKKKQKINCQHQGDQMVFMDSSLLKHIIMNLISNASKFSPEATPIDIKTSCYNGQLIFSIKDEGMGISREDQQHLMERFFRGTNATNIQGTGLGLHIVSKYAELMNGTVRCKSELEKGTEFFLTFNTKPSGYEKDLTDRG